MRESGLIVSERIRLERTARELTEATLRRIEAEREHERACAAYVDAIVAVFHCEIERDLA